MLNHADDGTASSSTGCPWSTSAGAPTWRHAGRVDAQARARAQAPRSLTPLRRRREPRSPTGPRLSCVRDRP